jgi:arylsulfatase A-like enzyme
MLGDVAPSILDAAGIPRPASMSGESLWPIWSGEDEDASGEAASVSRGIRGWALRTRNWKLIAEDVGGSPHVELYALTRDPGERRNLADRHPRVVAALRRRLGRRVAELTGIAQPGPLPVCPLCRYSEMKEFWDGALMPATGGDESVIDAATRARLRALGYLDH